MSRTYLRVPRVQRLEYLGAFLDSYGGSEFDEKRAQKAIQQKIHHFEIEKAKALGRQRPRTAGAPKWPGRPETGVVMSTVGDLEYKQHGRMNPCVHVGSVCVPGTQLPC